MRKLYLFQPAGLWLVITTAILWGTIGVTTQAIYQVDRTTSLFINLARMVIATPVLGAACWRVVGRDMFNIRARDFRIMALSGVLLAISHASYFAAIHYSGVTVSTLLTICLAPLVVTGVSVLLKLETLTRRTVGALVCAVLGSALLVGFRSTTTTGSDISLGTLFALTAAVSYGGMIVCGRFVAANYHPLQVTTVTFGAGTILLGIVNLISGAVAVHTAQGWLLVLYLGLVPTAFAYLLFQTGLRAVSATAASIIGMLDPVVAALLAWGLFGERLAVGGIVGALLMILSIFLLTARSRRT